MRSSFTTLFFLLAALLVPQACRTDYFLHPLPVDRRDRICVPPSLRGKYITDFESEYDTIQLMKRSLIYLREADTIDYTNRYTVRYDSDRQQNDTNLHYRIFGDQLFVADGGDGFLVNNWPYRLSGDTVQALRHDSVIIDLGMNCFFRKVKRRTYILNYKTDLSREDAKFWSPYLFRWNKKTIELIPLLPDDADSMKLHFYNQSNTYYYDLRWTARQIDSMLRKGLLVTETTLYRVR